MEGEGFRVKGLEVKGLEVKGLEKKVEGKRVEQDIFWVSCHVINAYI